MFEAISDGQPGVHFPRRAIHRLQEEVMKAEHFKQLGLGSALREDQFELIAGQQAQLRSRLGTDADPISPGGER